MKGTLIPGYKDLFGEADISYDDLLKNISSDTVIMLLASLNAELNTNEPHIENQERLFRIITYRFNPQQISHLKNALTQFKKTNADYNGTLFSRRYFLPMILKELKRNNKMFVDENNPIHEYNFLVAYLIIIDQVNEGDHVLLADAKRYNCQIMLTMPLIWATSIHQYEYNERSNPAFELFKLLCFCKYAYDKLRPFLKELINNYGFKTISQFTGSLFHVAKLTLNYQPNEVLRKLYFIVPKEGIRHDHLQSLSFSLGSDDISEVADLKRFPIYKTQKKGFMVVDEDFYKRKIYRGALFGLYKETTLSAGKSSFEDYKSDISKRVFEEILFKGIASQLTGEDSWVIHFDTLFDKSEPDMYCRYENNIFLIEFKDYLFPDSVMYGKGFGKFKKYVDERFIRSQNGKSKGVSQLSNCIYNLVNRKYCFDLMLDQKIKDREQLKIYPVICSTDFMFGMPGINEYLNILFSKQLREKRCNISGIRPMVILSLEVLYDLALRGKSFLKLQELIENYHSILNHFRREYLRDTGATGAYQIYLPSTASFDEIYQTKFRSSMIDKSELTSDERIKRMTNIIDLNQDQMNEEL